MTENPIRVEHEALVEYVARDADDGFWIRHSHRSPEVAFVELGAVDLPQ